MRSDGTSPQRWARCSAQYEPRVTSSQGMGQTSRSAGGARLVDSCSFRDASVAVRRKTALPRELHPRWWRARLLPWRELSDFQEERTKPAPAFWPRWSGGSAAGRALACRGLLGSLGRSGDFGDRLRRGRGGHGVPNPAKNSKQGHNGDERSYLQNQKRPVVDEKPVHDYPHDASREDSSAYRPIVGQFFRAPRERELNLPLQLPCLEDFGRGEYPPRGPSRATGR